MRQFNLPVLFPQPFGEIRGATTSLNGSAANDPAVGHVRHKFQHSP